MEIQPETGACEPPVAVEESEECSGGACVGVDDGTVEAGRECGGTATVGFTAAGAGQYILWARCRWTDACGDSFYLTMDGAPRRKFGQQGAEGEWLWLKGPTYALEAGNHELVISGREDGAFLDKVVLTTDSEFVPDGVDGCDTAKARTGSAR